MVQINFAQKQVNAKIVYYGPGMSGKTTNLEVIHERAPEHNRGELTSISTEGDRTLFFDFMPLDLGTVSGMRTCFQIYTVPGQVYYNSTRKLVLQGVDGVIFVADSSPNMMEENLESLANLAENLAEYGRSINEMPLVIQYNKRDIPGAFSIEELEEQLNPMGVPAFEAIANTGKGVFPTLKAVAASVLDSLHQQQSNASAGSSTSGPAPAEAAAPAPAPASMPAPVAAAAPDASNAPLPPTPAPIAPPPAAVVPPAPVAAAPARPTMSMSQTGFHKAPSVPLNTGEPQAVAPAESTPASAPELRLAPRTSAVPEMAPPAMAQPAMAQPTQAAQVPPASPSLQIQRPQPGQEPQAAAQPKAAMVQTRRQAPAAATPSSVMGVEAGASAPQRRAPASRSFPSRPAMPEPRATPQPERSALVTGLIIVASVGIGAVLGSFVLSLL